MSKIFYKPFYFLIFAIYPILALFANNIDQVDAIVIFRPVIISLLTSIILWIAFRLIFGNWHSASLFTAFLLVLFFLYGHMYDYIKNKDLFGFILGRHRILMLIWGGLIVGGFFFAFSRKRSIQNYAPTLNIIALSLLIFPVLTALSYWISIRSIPSIEFQSVTKLNTQENQSLPDVYYIILDSYTRSDVFRNVYGYDNSDFLNELNELGFYVAECSTSNYMWTRLSMSSSLNMEYLQELPSYLSATDKDVITEELIHHSFVRQNFESLGYKTVAFATGFPFNEITDVDLFLEPPATFKSTRGFEALLVKTTLLRVLQDFGYIKINQTASAEYRDRTLLALREFENFKEMGGPKFVYMHIITPHPPFVFGANGETVYPKDFLSTEGQYTDESYSTGYIDQVEFISIEIIDSIRTLLNESDSLPIIILQGDHGPWKQDGENRFSILNAYYMPGHEDELYQSISPVNSFRVVFNEYFNGNYPLLDDISFESDYGDEYNFRLQPTSCEE